MADEQVLPAVLELLAEYGDQIRWHHCGDSRACHGHTGFPDLFIAGPMGCILREVKPNEFAHLSRGQTAWRWMIHAAGQAGWDVWTQEDLDKGRIRLEIEALLGQALMPASRA